MFALMVTAALLAGTPDGGGGGGSGPFLTTYAFTNVRLLDVLGTVGEAYGVSIQATEETRPLLHCVLMTAHTTEPQSLTGAVESINRKLVRFGLALTVVDKRLELHRRPGAAWPSQCGAAPPSSADAQRLFDANALYQAEETKDRPVLQRVLKGAEVVGVLVQRDPGDGFLRTLREGDVVVAVNGQGFGLDGPHSGPSPIRDGDDVGMSGEPWQYPPTT
ncbi:MAG: hypothetical protein AB2A00_12485 [Myxococcota bacterium]